ncbi:MULTISPECIES: ester cyclase [Raoultella]|nr:MULTISPECIES: ester cyclase [Raoultella]MCI1035736.1 ester cyclase [Raoultella terrigena]
MMNKPQIVNDISDNKAASEVKAENSNENQKDKKTVPVSLNRLPRQLDEQHMPADFTISWDSYKRGGTDKFLAQTPSHLHRHPMRGFDKEYVNIIDYIIRITHRIWEEGDIGYIYDTYSHDCNVWDDVGLHVGRDRVVAGTARTLNAYPDIRILGDEVIWAGDENVGFHSSHRSYIMGTNTGFSEFGAPTNRPVRFMCIANCVMLENEIFYEHVLHNTASLIQQLGLNVFDVARDMMTRHGENPLARDFVSSEPFRVPGQGKPALLPLPQGNKLDVRAFINAFYQNVWNRRMLRSLTDFCSPNIAYQGPTERVYQGLGNYKSWILSLLAMFPDLTFSVDDVYWMGNDQSGYLVSVRWSAQGTHLGHGIYGKPTGKEVHLVGISQYRIQDNIIQQEWSIFNEFGVITQLVS